MRLLIVCKLLGASVPLGGWNVELKSGANGEAECRGLNLAINF